MFSKDLEDEGGGQGKGFFTLFRKPSALHPVLVLQQTAVMQKAATGIFSVSFPQQLVVAVCFEMPLFAPTAVGAER